MVHPSQGPITARSDEHIRVDVALGDRSYPIHIGDGLASQPDIAGELVGGATTLIVTNEAVAPLHGEAMRAAMPRARLAHCVLPDGEQYKNWHTLERVYDAAIEHGCDRDATVVALGGGVVGDMAGFAAATYMRGISLIQIPTTLLAQVDASVGGKTGVNHPRGKNMIGAFYQPRAVIADTAVLATLPEREFRAGLAEVIKYGLLGDRALFEWLEDTIDALTARRRGALASAIERSCRDKAAIVGADEREQGQRALLNLGHTFAHAIEARVGYQGWLHGEAVAAGLCLAADLSQRLGLVDDDVRGRVAALVAAAGLPTTPPRVGRERLKASMAHDKKNRAGRLRFVLLDAIGAARVVGDVPEDALDATLASAEPVAGTL
ncbi:MAG: 3-dehydroquinate synthase [Proteobacteria bacterium SW_6_67_9]|nr:MAG: 3-dehydroquinate synthase [Proteobacteria bacterium SW_6_67_9]